MASRADPRCPGAERRSPYTLRMPGGDPLATCTLPVGVVYLLTYCGTSIATGRKLLRAEIILWARRRAGAPETFRLRTASPARFASACASSSRIKREVVWLWACTASGPSSPSASCSRRVRLAGRSGPELIGAHRAKIRPGAHRSSSGKDSARSSSELIGRRFGAGADTCPARARRREPRHRQSVLAFSHRRTTRRPRRR